MSSESARFSIWRGGLVCKEIQSPKIASLTAASAPHMIEAHWVGA
jgi:hypothetical protein